MHQTALFFVPHIIERGIEGATRKEERRCGKEGKGRGREELNRMKERKNKWLLK